MNATWCPNCGRETFRTGSTWFCAPCQCHYDVDYLRGYHSRDARIAELEAENKALRSHQACTKRAEKERGARRRHAKLEREAVIAAGGAIDRAEKAEAENARLRKMAACTHDSSSTGVDTAPNGPDKVWRCDECGFTYRAERDAEGWYQRVPVWEATP